jgi:hypothetical protein
MEWRRLAEGEDLEDDEMKDKEEEIGTYADSTI